MVRSNDDWERIGKSPLTMAYLSELYWLARDSVETCERVFSAAMAPPPEKSYIKVDHHLHGEIYRILNNAARLRALVNVRSKRYGQSAGQFAVQESRIRWLLDLIGDLPMAAISQAKVRNSLEHYDEYLDEAALKSSRGELDRPTLFPIDMTLGRDGTLDQFTSGVVYPLRVYLAEERIFVNCGQRISLGDVFDECVGIRDRLAELAPQVLQDDDVSSHERGSSMIVVTDSSFGG